MKRIFGALMNPMNSCIAFDIQLVLKLKFSCFLTNVLYFRRIRQSLH
jgi:hypothetical protein